MKNHLLSALLALAAPMLVSAACPAGSTPANFLIGKTWAFQLGSGFTAAIGTFKATGPGYLAITETVVDTPFDEPTFTFTPQSVTIRQAPTSGRWTVNADCTGGTLDFMLNREHFALQFQLNATGDLMNITGLNDSNSIFNLNIFFGVARLNPPSGCPAGLGNPLNLIKGATYNYTLGGNGGFFEQGTFTASFPNPAAYSGDLKLNRTIVDLATDGDSTSFFPNFPTYGRYIIYPDCSGGELLFNNNGKDVQFEFVFSAADFSELYMLNDSLVMFTTTGQHDFPRIAYAGTATRQ